MAKFIKAAGSFMVALLISPEFLLLLAAVAVGNLFGIKLVSAIPESASRPEVVKWAALFPLIPVAYSIKNWRELLSPDHKAVCILADWPDRDHLFMIFRIGITYQVVFASMAVFFWIFDSLIPTRYGAPLFAASILGSLISVATHYYGWIKLRLLLNTVRLKPID